MKPSKLSDHVLKKGKFTTPLNAIPAMTELEDEKTWTHGRLPEYLWIGLILKQYGRTVGLAKMYDIVTFLHEIAPGMSVPRISDILALDSSSQAAFYEHVCSVVSRETLAPMTLFLTQSKYPVFAQSFACQGLSISDREKTIINVMKEIFGHQTNDSTDIRFVVLYFFAALSGRLCFQNREQVDFLLEYPVLDHSAEKMRMFRPLVRSAEMIVLQSEKANSDYLRLFWGRLSCMTQCSLYSVHCPDDKRDIDAYMEHLHDVFSYLSQLFVTTSPLDEKMNVLLGISTYSYKRLREVVDHGLCNSISGRSCMRVLIEDYIMMKYLIKNEPEHPDIWREFQFYGIGLYKLALGRHRERDGVDPNCHFNAEYIQVLVNEFKSEEFINMDTRYFDQQNIRKKAEAVGEADLYGLYYDYDSSFEHGLWGAIRESSLLKCDNPAHQYHCTPDVDDRVNLKSVLPDCIGVMNKTLALLNETYGIPSALLEGVTNYALPPA